MWTADGAAHNKFWTIIAHINIVILHTYIYIYHQINLNIITSAINIIFAAGELIWCFSPNFHSAES